MPTCDADPDENITGEILAPNLKKNVPKRYHRKRLWIFFIFFCAFCERCHWLSTNHYLLHGC
jgi:hypothetical protein